MSESSIMSSILINRHIPEDNNEDESEISDTDESESEEDQSISNLIIFNKIKENFDDMFDQFIDVYHLKEWTWFAGEHFDWFMFPWRYSTSSFGKQFNINDDISKMLINDGEFIFRFCIIVRIIVMSWRYCPNGFLKVRFSKVFNSFTDFISTMNKYKDQIVDFNKKMDKMIKTINKIEKYITKYNIKLPKNNSGYNFEFKIKHPSSFDEYERLLEIRNSLQ